MHSIRSLLIIGITSLAIRSQSKEYVLIIPSPLNCENKSINVAMQEVRTVLKYYGSLSSALVNLFPEVQLDLSKFLVLPRIFVVGGMFIVHLLVICYDNI